MARTRTPVVFLLFFLLFAALFLYFRTEGQRYVVITRDEALTSMFAFVEGLTPAPNQVVGILECTNAGCEQGKTSGSGGFFWPLYGASVLATAQDIPPELQQAAFKIVESYPPHIQEIVSNSTSNPTLTFFMLEKAYRALLLKGQNVPGIIEPFLTAMTAQTFAIENDPRPEIHANRSLMVLSQLARQTGLFKKLVSEPETLGGLHSVSVVSGIINLDPAGWQSSADVSMGVLEKAFTAAIMPDGENPMTDNPDYCWATAGISAPLLAGDNPQLLDKVEFLIKSLYKDESGFWRNNPSLHSYIPCLDVITRFNTPYFREVRRSKVEKVLNKFLDIKQRPICNGDGGVLGNTTQYEQQPLCERNLKYQSDINWLIEMVSRFPKTETFKLKVL